MKSRDIYQTYLNTILGGEWGAWNASIDAVRGTYMPVVTDPALRFMVQLLRRIAADLPKNDELTACLNLL